MSTLASFFRLAVVAVLTATDIASQARPGSGADTTASGVIEGVVIAAGAAARPIRRAIVTAVDDTGDVSASAVTSDDGRFILLGLSAGYYRVSVVRPGYVPVATGRISQGSRAQLRLGGGEKITDVILRMDKGATLSGIVRDRDGAGLNGLRVSAFQARIDGSYVAAATTVSDAHGEYRLFGLRPGQYIVAASPRRETLVGASVEVMSRARVDAVLAALERRESSFPSRANATGSADPNMPTMRLSPVFYPGTLDAATATRIPVGAGVDAAGLDIQWTEPATAEVEGVVVGPPDAAGLITVTMKRSPIAAPFAAGEPRLTLPPDTNGRFRFAGVTHGRHVLEALVPAPRRAGSPSDSNVWWGRVEIAVTVEHLSGLVIPLQPPLNIRGRLLFDGRPPGAEELSRTRVTLDAPSSSGDGGLTAYRRPSAVLQSDGTFRLSGVIPGRYMLGITAPGRVLARAMFAGQDVLDRPFEIRPDLSGILEATLTTRTPSLSGTLQVPSRHTATIFTVVLLRPQPVSGPSSIFVRTVIADPQGRFVFTDLPPGDYLAAVTTALEEEDLSDPAFLNALREASVGIILRFGERRQLDLKVTW